MRTAPVTFDDLGRLLKSIGTYAGEEPVYAYDANGQRVEKTVGAAVTHYIYDLSGRRVAAGRRARPYCQRETSEGSSGRSVSVNSASCTSPS